MNDDREPISGALGPPRGEEPAHRFFVTPFFESRRPTLMTAVEDCMTREVVTCAPEDTVYDAARKMLDAKVSALPVVSGTQVEGVLSLSDMLYRLETPQGRIADALLEWLGGSRPDFRKHMAFRVKEAMSQPAITVDTGATVESAARCMLQHRIHQIPVLSGGKLAGIVTRRDIIGALAAWAEQTLPQAPNP